MAVETMPSSLDKLKKMRGRTWDEIRTRGGQAMSAYGEKIGFGERIPSDADFAKYIDREVFGKAPVIAESLWQHFFKNAEQHFFAPFRRPLESADHFRETFGPEVCNYFVDAAERIVSGRIDLFGLKNVFVGTEIDWHVEPISRICSPLKHWKEFDDNDKTESGDKKLIWELNRHQHFFTLGVAYWLTKDSRYSTIFVRHLESWIETNPPGIGINWASSLEVAFRSMSWIWAFQFFRNADEFTPTLFKNAVKALYSHGRHIEKYLSKYYSPNTHLTGEALGLYYLGTQLNFLERSSHWRQVSEVVLFSEIERQILPDGVYFEQSTWYQRYTVDFYTHFAILKSLYNNEPGGLPADKLEARLSSAFSFLMHLTRPDGTIPMIGDDDGGRMLPLTDADPDDFRGTLGSGAALFGRGDLKSVAGNMKQEVFWLFGREGELAYDQIGATEPEKSSMGFPDGGYYSMRDGWLETDNHLIVDCGDVGAMSGGHGHADALSVEVSLKGWALLVDPGTYTYHESTEMRDHFRSTAAHNTLTVDCRSSSEPRGTFSWRSKAEAKVLSWVSEERFDYFEGSHNGYSRLDKAATHERSILFLKNDYIIIRDFVRTRGEHEYSLNFHFPVGKKATAKFNSDFVEGEDWRLYSFGDDGYWEQRESWTSKSFGNKTNAPYLRFSANGKGSQEFYTILLPSDSGFEKPVVTEMPVEGGRAFAINYRRYSDVVIFNHDHRNIIETELFKTNFRMTWTRVDADTCEPEEYVLISGNRFDIGGSEIVGGSGELQFAAIRAMGNSLNLKTDKGRFRVSLP